MPFGELLVRKNKDCFREASSVNNVPQVSGLPATLTFPFDDGSGFQDEKALYPMAVSQEKPWCQPSGFWMLWGMGMPARRAALVLSLSPQRAPTTSVPALFGGGGI